MVKMTEMKLDKMGLIAAVVHVDMSVSHQQVNTPHRVCASITLLLMTRRRIK